jgi:hypothetical protein
MSAPRPTLPGVVVRSGPPRVMRSPLTGTWYVITPPYRDMGEGRIIAGRKREVHPDDQAHLEEMVKRSVGKR